MKRKIIVLLLCLVILVYGCNSTQPEMESLPVEVSPSATTLPAIPKNTSTATVINTPSPTPIQMQTPDNPADCTNAAAFISDVTIPDNSFLRPNEYFVKTWRVKNIGTCTWWAGYTLEHYAGDSLNATKLAKLPYTEPGEIADISIELQAPGTAKAYQGVFVIKNPKGLIMRLGEDSRLWVAIQVNTSEAAGGPTSGNPPNPNKATCVFTTETARTEELLVAINEYRSQNDLPPYNSSVELTEAAQSHANDMACNKFFFSHYGSDGSTPQTRADAAGYTGIDVTESVYGSFPPLAREKVEEIYRGGIPLDGYLNDQYLEIGIGYSFFEGFGCYVVVYGAP